MAEPAVVHFRAMGACCRIVVGGGPDDLATKARDLVVSLEQRWSRFLGSSEISSLNRLAGRLTLVSEPTYRLMQCAAAAVARTNGRFNPLMLDQLEGNGYQNCWQNSAPIPDERLIEPATTEPITIHSELTAVTIPFGCRFDPGGIGKGLAVDMAVEFCLDAGADTVSVELGGDLRVDGIPWYGPQWRIGVADPYQRDEHIAWFTPTQGAVATSSTLQKSWSFGGRQYHHLLDPATGQPAMGGIVSVTTCAAQTWWAEVVAKSALISGRVGWRSELERLGVPGIAVDKDGDVLAQNDAVVLGSAPFATEVGQVEAT